MMNANDYDEDEDDNDDDNDYAIHDDFVDDDDDADNPSGGRWHDAVWWIAACSGLWGRISGGVSTARSYKV